MYVYNETNHFGRIKKLFERLIMLQLFIKIKIQVYRNIKNPFEGHLRINAYSRVQWHVLLPSIFIYIQCMLRAAAK